MHLANVKRTSRAILPQGNLAFASGDHSAAVRHYLDAMVAMPEVASHIVPNLQRIKARHAARRAADQCSTVAVCGWELSHNAAGRVYALAKLYETFARTEVVGCTFPQYGSGVWPPLLDSDIPILRHIHVHDEGRFLELALDLVLNHPYDVVHLSKPRIPNVFIGLLYKIIWNSRIIMDIDDEELAFVGGQPALSLEKYLQEVGRLPRMDALDGEVWTRLAVSMIDRFDGITVCNRALQKRYGGTIVRHARDERIFKVDYDARLKVRADYGIGPDKKVVLFLGTPRRHKGLVDLMKALSAMGRSDLVLVVIGTFDDDALKRDLTRAGQVEIILKENQPFRDLPRLLALGDYCILLQDPGSAAAQWQTPAKLTDALAMEIPVLLSATPGIDEFVEADVVTVIGDESLSQAIERFVSAGARDRVQAGRDFFERYLSYAANAKQLQTFIASVASTAITEKMNERLLRSLLAATPYCDALVSLAMAGQPLETNPLPY